MKNILIIGSLNMDMVIEMGELPKQGETVLGFSMDYIPGGKGANQACAAGKSGGNVGILGCVGMDNFGTTLVESLKNSGVDVTGISKVSDKPTGTAVIYVDDKGANCIVVVPGANDACNIDYLRSHDEMFKTCDYVLLQMEIPEESIYYAIRKAKEYGKMVILNPAPAPNVIPDEILKKIDYITPNETELETLTKIPTDTLESVEWGAEVLLNKGVKHVLVTLGEKGSYLIGKGKKQYFPAREVRTVDTTAAGDCFNGAFVTALAEGKCEMNAISFANIASSIAVTRKGAQISIPVRKEIEEIEKTNSR